MLMAYIYSIDT